MSNQSHLILLTFLLVFSCSSDDNDSSPANFYEAHVGVWKTTFSDNSQLLLDIYETGWDAYSRTSSNGCWSAPNTVGGTTTIDTNTPEELTACTRSIPAGNVFTGSDLTWVYNLGYTNVSVCQSYLDSGSMFISFAQVWYAGVYDVELLTVSGNLGKQNSSSFDTCKANNSQLRYYTISEEAKKVLIN